MSAEKLTKLETFIERHRPDFDAHEPSPDLWARLEEQLSQPGSGVGPVLLTNEPTEPALEADLFTHAASAPVTETPVLSPAKQPRRSLAQYGIAAALAVLVVAAVFSEVRRPAAEPNIAVAAAPDDMPDTSVPADAAYLGPGPQALAAGERMGTPDPRLTAAVRGMESYYASQLSSRQAELRELDAQTSLAADWPRELAALDSSYRQLKEELPHHPQPEVVLTAMNRNLQIRIDILDQQLQHRSAGQEAEAVPSGTMVSLADSRP
jgi:hypothetical protein